MALTATAQSAFHREPAWDEVIVPTLRKRLKDESNVLARRISAASMGEADDSDPYSSSPYLRQQPPSPAYSSHTRRPSAIPRPSLTQSRNGADSYEVYNQSAQSGYQRSRTSSQPTPVDLPVTRAAAIAASVENRPTSPASLGVGSRIPMSRGRAGSASQGSLNGSALSHTASRPSGDASSKRWRVDETQRSNTSRSTTRVPRHQASELFNEQAPFSANSSTSFHYEHDYVQGTRMSSDSEEHPFEHWYRGDVSRNGGVGELRVGRRDEMLDIANYGHTFRKVSSTRVASNFSRSRSTSRGRDGVGIGGRLRAGSVGAARESIYLDEDVEAHDGRMVLDEQPPTDMDSEGETYEDQEDTYVEQDVMPHPNGTVSSPSLSLTPSRSTNTTASRQKLAPGSASRIPTPSSFRQTSPQTPSKPTRTGSEPGTSSAARSPSAKRAPVQAPAQQASSTAKRRAKSPATTASATKKTRGQSKPPSSMQKKSTRKEENRRSIGQYPATDGEDIVDAIPTWTQPIPASGNWDDVVLPVVARKKGMDGHYARADGSPQPPVQRESPPEPAPGTFGYDHTKYRPPRVDMRPDAIPMDEFGQKTTVVEAEDVTVVNEQPLPVPSPSRNAPAETERARTRPSPPPSPAPFAHYAQSAISPIGGDFVKIPPPQPMVKEVYREEDDGAGCCKCVIM